MRIKTFQKPAWLPQELFLPATATSTIGFLSSKRRPISGPRRTIAHRGTEIFVAVGKEIRWADLARLKDASSLQERRPDFHEYKTIKVPVGDDIRQLIISPNDNLLAIRSEEHTSELQSLRHLVCRLLLE